MSCSVCAKAVVIDDSLSNVGWGDKLNVSENAIRRHLKHTARVVAAKPEEPVTLSGKAVFDSTGGEFTDVQTETPLTDWSDIFARFNRDPAEFIIADDTVRMSTWQQSKGLEDGTRDVVNLYSYSARFTRKTPAEFDSIDPVGILAQLRATRSPKRATSAINHAGDESTFVVSINDVQLGQSYNGGSDATINAFHEFIELTVERINELRTVGRRLERLVLVCGGDLVEGCFIYPHQMASLDLNRKKQMQGVVALLLHALDTLAPMFETVTVLATKGNHGEHRENGKKIDLSDNDDTLCVEMAKLALERDASMQHIEWIIADEEAAVWTDVYGWTLVTTHGDIYAKGVSGATTERKAHAWLKNMAAAFRKFGRIGRADVLITHHFHHDEMADWGDTLWRQTTSQDRGSPEFSQATGQYSEPGMLTAVMTRKNRWKDEAVLR